MAKLDGLKKKPQDRTVGIAGSMPARTPKAPEPPTEEATATEAVESPQDQAPKPTKRTSSRTKRTQAEPATPQEVQSPATPEPAAASEDLEESDVEPAEEHDVPEGDASEPIVAKMFWVRPEAKAWIHEHARELHCTNADAIQEAIELAYDELAARAPEQPKTTRRLFAKSPRSGQRRRDGLERTQVFARFTQTNLDIIDGLVDELGAGNRSLLVEDAVFTILNHKEN